MSATGKLLGAALVLVIGAGVMSVSTEPAAALKEQTGVGNRLRFEKSPYLLQHADNPVDWYPWGDEAFEKAKREDKPIFLSIGYSTCHWCHVMEHESFEDAEVAALMNRVFVSIKVDREERPDIDDVYMTVCQLATGSGGWPLTIIMTPDRKPFFAGTYFPKKSRYGRIGMMELIPRIEEAWKTKRGDILKSSAQILGLLRQASETSAGDDLGRDVLDAAYRELSRRFDETNGGFGGAPKFPTPHNLTFLLRYWKRTGEARALKMVEATLNGMRRGGIYDHVGFGFHRYSTDAVWLVPHFEKMLYDQAQLVMAYTETYQATGNKGYEKTAREVLAYVLRDMTSPRGGFYSAEDADSEGEEGRFYVWAEKEILDVLGEREGRAFIDAYGVTADGNFREEASGKKTGRNIPHVNTPFFNDTSRAKLFDVREKRVHPYKDDKIMADWNGLMIAALAKAARAFDEPAYADAARRAADFILETMRTKEGRLLHRYRDGEAAVPAYLDDYAFLVWGLLELYEAVFDVRYLAAARDLNEIMLDRFEDTTDGGFFFTADDAEELLLRKKDYYDGAVPAGNSVAVLNLLRLARIMGVEEFEKSAEAAGRSAAGSVRRAASAHTQLLSGVDFGLGPSHEVVIAGETGAEDTKAMLQALEKEFMPGTVVLLRPTEKESPEITAIAEFTEYYTGIKGKATAYVCVNRFCSLPTTDTLKMLELLKNGKEKIPEK